jgi:hypothetical protein
MESETPFTFQGKGRYSGKTGRRKALPREERRRECYLYLLLSPDR